MDGIKCILLDIEGTILPISFVKETLFPYALQALPQVLESKWDDPAFAPYRNAFPEEHRQSPADFQAHVEDLTLRDVKVAYLKNLQGFLWEDGYQSGAYATNLFADVVPQLRQWQQQEGLSLAIYSSGSIFAQKLLFGHVLRLPPSPPLRQMKQTAVEAATAVAPALSSSSAGAKKCGRPADFHHGAEDQANDGIAQPLSSKNKHDVDDVDDDDDDDDDDDGDGDDGDDAAAADHRKPAETEDLTAMFEGRFFDTTNAGLKTEASSYAKIAETLKWQPEEILFLSDNVKEIDAAHEAKLNAILVDRPGNAALDFADRRRLQIVESLSEIYINKGPGTELGQKE